MENLTKMTAKLIKYPTADDWLFCKRCTPVTVGKESTKEPTAEWKHKILEARHSRLLSRRETTDKANMTEPKLRRMQRSK